MIPLQSAIDEPRKYKQIHRWMIDHLAAHVDDSSIDDEALAEACLAEIDADEGQARAIATAIVEELEPAIAYFDIDGWDEYQGWLALSDEVLNQAIDAGHPSAKYAKTLKNAGYTAGA